MRRLFLLALLVSFAAGCGSTRQSGPDTSLESTELHDVPSWIQAERLPARAIPGAHLFASAGCTACHTYAGSGSSILGAPDLTAIGARFLGITLEIRHLQCPSCVNPGSPMPKFASLGPKRLREIAIFLEASKGTH